MIITFCGHSTISDDSAVRAWLEQVTETLISQGATTFYLGGYGAFDTLCLQVLTAHKKTYPQIELLLILPYLNHKLSSHGYDGTIYPPLETTPLKFSILARNRWMVQQADCVVAYVTYGWGGAQQTLTYARQRRKRILSYTRN